jgi:hypothetical protein
MTAMGCRAAAAAVVGSPSSGAGTSDGAGLGVAVAAGVAVGPAVADDVALADGSAIAGGEAVAVALAIADGKPLALVDVADRGSANTPTATEMSPTTTRAAASRKPRDRVARPG